MVGKENEAPRDGVLEHEIVFPLVLCVDGLERLLDALGVSPHGLGRSP